MSLAWLKDYTAAQGYDCYRDSRGENLSERNHGFVTSKSQLPRVANLLNFSSSSGAFYFESNNSNKSDIAICSSSSDIYRNCQYSGKIIKVEGDGRCLFRSLVTCKSTQLQKALRDEFGCPVRHEDALFETQMADELRLSVVRMMRDNAHFYSQLDSGLINADQTINESGLFQKFQERLDAMTYYSTMPGDLELNVTSTVLEVRILVLDTRLRYIYMYGKDKFPNAPVLAVRYTRLGPDVGHYDSVVLELPFHDQVDQIGQQEIDPVDLGSDPALQEFAALSLTSRSTHKAKANLVQPQADKQEKASQTQSCILLAKNQEERAPRAPGNKEETRGMTGKGDVRPSHLSKTSRLPSDPPLNPPNDSVHDSFTPLTSRKSEKVSRRKIFKTNTRKVSRENGVIVPRRKSPQVESQTHRVFRRSPQSRGLSKTLVKHVQVKNKQDNRVNKSPPPSCGMVPTHSQATGKKLRPVTVSKRKLQDLNENHKSKRPKKMQSERKTPSPDELTKRTKKTKSLQSRNQRKQKSSTDNDVTSPIRYSPDVTAKDPLPLSSQENRCYVCQGSIPVSRLMGLRCFLCNKVAHRPCVSKYLEWDPNKGTDPYFTCQSCFPL